MGHAFKILVVWKDHMEILHYTFQEAADAAFDQIADSPLKLDALKLYKPEKTFHRRRGENYGDY